MKHELVNQLSTCPLRRTVRTNRFFQMNRSFQRYHLRPWATCDLWPLAVPVSFLHHRMLFGWEGCVRMTAKWNEYMFNVKADHFCFECVVRMETTNGLQEEWQIIVLFFTLRWIWCRQRVNWCLSWFINFLSFDYSISYNNDKKGGGVDYLLKGIQGVCRINPHSFPFFLFTYRLQTLMHVLIMIAGWVYHLEFTFFR